MVADLTIGEIGDGRRLIRCLAISWRILTPTYAQQDLQGGFAGLGQGQFAVLSEDVEAAAASAPVGDDEGLLARRVDPQAERGERGVPEIAAARPLIDRFGDGPLVEPDLHGADSQILAWGRDLSRSLGP